LLSFQTILYNVIVLKCRTYESEPEPSGPKPDRSMALVSQY
jgi:hypothetical protein